MELWDVYDINRNKTGKTAVRGEGLPEGGFHLVVHVCILGSDGRMLIQKRRSNTGFPACGTSARGVRQSRGKQVPTRQCARLSRR